MPRNNVGVYTLPQAPFVPGTVISSAAVNSDFSDIATALTGSIAANGSTPITNQLTFFSGSASLPGIAFVGDKTTGVYLPVAGQLGLTAGAGAAGVVLDSTQVGTGKSGNQLYYTNGAMPNPVGMVTDFAGSTAPTGWYLCYGQTLSRTGYPELFNVIGTTYGIGDGSTTFNLPDCRGSITAGLDNMGGTAANRITSAGSGIAGTTLGASGGSQNQTLTTGQIPQFSPSFTGTSHTWTINQGNIVQNANDTLAGGGSAVFGGESVLATLTVTVTPAGTISTIGSASPTPVITMPPVIMFNKIIFAGRP